MKVLELSSSLTGIVIEEGLSAEKINNLCVDFAWKYKANVRQMIGPAIYIEKALTPEEQLFAEQKIMEYM